VLDQFREVLVVDTEFTAIPGERFSPVCLVAREMRSGRTHRIFQGQFGPVPPYSTGPDTLFVAFVASAELGVHHVLGWPMPKRVLDLYAEFRCHTNMVPIPVHRGQSFRRIADSVPVIADSC
jgi:hypothetical protein